MNLKYVITTLALLASVFSLSLASRSYAQSADEEPTFEHLQLPDRSKEVFATTVAPGGQVVGAVLSPELAAVHKQRIRDLATKGYIEMLDREPRADYVLARMDERRAMASLQGRPDDPKLLGFERLSAVEARGFSSLPFKPSILPARYRKADSEGYLLSGGSRLKQLHTRTEFGTLLIDESANSTIDLGASNAEVARHTAVLVPIKHKNGRWATMVLTEANGRAFLIECDSLITGEEKSAFLAMASDVVANAN